MSEKREAPRSEQVRTRQTQKKTIRLTQATERAYRPTTAPARKQSYVATRNKRRFNIAVGMPGADLRGPAIMFPSLRPGWRTASFLLTILLGAAIYLAWTLPYFRIATATVMGNERLSSEEIYAGLGVSGQPIFALQPDEIATRLRINYPELASVQVDVYFPNQIYVTVAERHPVILWQQGEGYTWIDAGGVAFLPRGFVADLVPVVGLAVPPAGIASPDDPLSPPPYMTKELVDAILALAPNLPAGVSMNYDPQNGLGWTDARGWQAFFGTNSKDMVLKLRVYQSLTDSLAARGIVPVLINVAYPDAPYYRLTPPGTTTGASE